MLAPALRKGEKSQGDQWLSMYVSPEKASEILSSGVRIRDTNFDGDKAKVEEIVADEGKKHGMQIDRKRAVFAYPYHPSKLKELPISLPGDILLEIKMSPNIKAVVADAETFTEASVCLQHGDMARARSWARKRL